MERPAPRDASSDRCAVCGLCCVIHSIKRSSCIVAESPAMRAVLRRAARFAAADAPVMILGESGSGKEVVARALHESSPRGHKPFVAVNVAALPGDLLESELFGHARGAFTGATAAKAGLFEAAEGGMLFLDEIAEIPLPLQAKLLRALQDGEVRRVGETRSFTVDVRIVCATHRDLAVRVADGLFRQDLLFRLKVLTLRVPPLRERREDVVPLAKMLIEERREDLRLTPAAVRLLESYSWPGNVRELQNAIKHGVALAEDGVIDVTHLPEDIATPRPLPAKRVGKVLRSLTEVEREHVLQVLRECGGSHVEAARVLGIGRNTLWRKLRSYD